MAISTTRPNALPPLQRVLVVGGGGREHALTWALGKCPGMDAVRITPGNGGLVDEQRDSIAETDGPNLVELCRRKTIDLVVVGPEAPLAAGVADHLRQAGIPVFGPGAEGAKLEASKAWAKQLMRDAGIPTAGHWSVTSEAQALAVLEEVKRPLVVKADGLAAGKGVTVRTQSQKRNRPSAPPSRVASARRDRSLCWKNGFRDRRFPSSRSAMGNAW